MALFQGFFAARWSAPSSPSAAPGWLRYKSEVPPQQKDPHDNSGVLGGNCDPTLLNFCFPLGARTLDEWRRAPPKDFSFTLTGTMGDRLHGHCSVVWPDSSLPQVLCFLSTHSYFDMFTQVMRAPPVLRPPANCLQTWNGCDNT